MMPIALSVAFCLAVNALTGNKDRPGRLVVWIGLQCLIIAALEAPLWLLFHPRSWVLFVSAVAVVLVIPDPKWVKR